MSAGEWRPPIVATEATTGRGLDELVDTIERFRGQSALVESRRRARASTQLRSIVADRLMEQVDVAAHGRRDGEAGRSHCGSHARSLHRGERNSRERTGQRMKAILDHVGIAVADLDASLAFFRDGLGLEVEPPEDVPSQRVRAQFLATGPSSLELLQATSPDSPIAKFLAKRGPGLHHITLRVDDIARGARAAAAAPRAPHRRRAPRRRRGSPRGVYSSIERAWRARGAEADRHASRWKASGRRRSRSETSRS